MDVRTNKRRNVLTHEQVNFSQSETSSLLSEGGVTIFVTTGEEGGSGHRKDPNIPSVQQVSPTMNTLLHDRPVPTC